MFKRFAKLLSNLLSDRDEPVPPRPRDTSDDATVLQLAEVLSGGDFDIVNNVRMCIENPISYFEESNPDPDTFTSPRDLRPIDVVYALLRRKQLLGEVDWRGDVDDVKDELAPLLTRQGINHFDWSFVQKLEEQGNWEALQAANLLNRIHDLLLPARKVLISLNMGSDSYAFAIVSPPDFEKVKSLKGKSFEISETFA